MRLITLSANPSSFHSLIIDVRGSSRGEHLLGTHPSCWYSCRDDQGYLAHEVYLFRTSESHVTLFSDPELSLLLFWSLTMGTKFVVSKPYTSSFLSSADDVRLLCSEVIQDT